MKDKRVSETIRIKSFGTGVVNGKMTAIGIPVCVVFDCATGKTYTDLASLADFIYGKILEGKMKYLSPLDYLQSSEYDSNHDGLPDCNECRNGFVPGYTTLKWTNE